ncbi:tail fiber protein [Escherichia coli]|nr:tail fiber protein [Escherichia coli]
MPFARYFCIFINVGLGEGSALPVGVPVPWPSAVPPAGWMKCNGSTFNLASYPALAAVFPSGVLPDLRGEFIRGWDDGRGVDTGRGILSAQGDAIRNIVGSISGLAVLETGTAKGAIKITASSNTSRWEGVTSGRGLIRDLDFDSSGTPDVNVAKEVRPRNIAFNYIVRAV